MLTNIILLKKVIKKKRDQFLAIDLNTFSLLFLQNPSCLNIIAQFSPDLLTGAESGVGSITKEA